MIPLGKEQQHCSRRDRLPEIGRRNKLPAISFSGSEAGQLNCPALFGGNALERAAAPPYPPFPRQTERGNGSVKNQKTIDRKAIAVRAKPLTPQPASAIQRGWCGHERKRFNRMTTFQPNSR